MNVMEFDRSLVRRRSEELLQEIRAQRPMKWLRAQSEAGSGRALPAYVVAQAALGRKRFRDASGCGRCHYSFEQRLGSKKMDPS
jgi:hypothetical protein